MDNFSRECLQIPLVLKQVFPAILSSLILFLVGLFLVYGYLSQNAKRPLARRLSFALMSLGLLLGVPKFLWQVAYPTLVPSNLVLHVIFAIGDVASHVGFVMLVYWDIVNEGLRLAFALDPQNRRRGVKMSTAVGLICMMVEGVFLTIFWILVYDMEELLDEDCRDARFTLSSTFAVVQYALVFGAIPSLAFGKLLWGLHKLWKDLPRDIPRHLLYRLRFTQLCLALLTLLGITDGIVGLVVGLIPFWTSFSGFIYENVALNALSAFTILLLGIEVLLTHQQAKRRIKDSFLLEEEQIRELIKHGVSILASNQRPTTLQPDHLVLPPVWERGLFQGIADRFLDIYAGEKSRGDCTSEDSQLQDPATSDVCIQLVKPMTEAARCSMWECLSAGFMGSQISIAVASGKYQYLAKPTVMVSHCWSSSYRELMQILKRYDENTNRSNYFFLDVFSMNQHDFADLGTPRDSLALRDMYDTMLEALTQSIKVPGCMLLALTPHDRPKMLTRSWCLYEIYIAWKVKAEVSCGFIPEAEEAMKRSLTKDDRFIRRLLNTIDAEASAATVKTDRDMILQLIHSAGIQRFNSFVREKLRNSLRVVALTTLREVEGERTDSEVPSPRSEASEPATRSAFVHAGLSGGSPDFHSEETISF